MKLQLYLCGAMVIAVNTSILNIRPHAFGSYFRQLLLCVTVDQPQHQFIFIYDRKTLETTEWGSNVSHRVVGPAARHPLLLKLWYDHRIPRILQKVKADLFISPGGLCSLNTSVPQLIITESFDQILASKRKGTQLLYYRKFVPKCLEHAASVITNSHFVKNGLTTQFPFVEKKTSVIYEGARKTFHPLDADKKGKVRSLYSGGREFFLCPGTFLRIGDMINLLKAFSIFKKRQRSEMKLVIASEAIPHPPELLEKIRTYRFRDDVVVAESMNEYEMSQLSGAAYATICPVPVVEALASGTAVIAADHSVMKEICGEHALYTDPADPVSLAGEMMHIYKDEDLRDRLASGGITQASSFSMEEAARLFWDCMRKTADVNS